MVNKIAAVQIPNASHQELIVFVGLAGFLIVAKTEVLVRVEALEFEGAAIFESGCADGIVIDSLSVLILRVDMRGDFRAINEGNRLC